MDNFFFTNPPPPKKISLFVLLEVIHNLACLQRVSVTLFLPLHLSTCLSASPTSRSYPIPLSSIMRRWMVLCHAPGSSEGQCSVWGKCQSLTGGGGGRAAGWKMSSFTGKSCEPRNVSRSHPPPTSTSTPRILPSHTVSAQCVCSRKKFQWERRGRGSVGVTQQIFIQV